MTKKLANGIFLWRFGIFYGDLVYFMAIWYILWRFGIFYGDLVYFMAIWYIFCSFDICILWSFGLCCGNLVYFVVTFFRFVNPAPSSHYCVHGLCSSLNRSETEFLPFPLPKL
jgi:hypothetical protein